MQKRTEKDYVHELKKGSYSAFDYLFSVYKERLYAFAVGYLKVPEDAKELVQEVFVRVWENRNKLDEEKSFNSYLFTISKNTILNYFRKKAHKEAYLEYIRKHTGLSVSQTEEDIEYQELLERTNGLVEQLPSRQKVIYRLSREKGMSNEEIARMLNISKKTVENQITLAIKFLREQLGNGKLIALLFISLFF
ncbi:MAG: RNA polymerase sigma-70 factor [Chlorobi bacterium]|nr:RNA polymerase sigma-70 factor [Chlorobiota bacterium]